MDHIAGMATLEKETLREVTEIKRQISKSLRFRLKQRGVTVASLARDTGTSRTAIRRVLDKRNTAITLYTIVRTAKGLGYRLRLSMEPSIDKIERVPTPAEAEPLMAVLGRALERLPAHR
jgi:transcriptional regulator with XRE-family HTH domain